MLKVLTGKISQSPKIQDLLQRFKDGRSVSVEGAVGSVPSVITSITAVQGLQGGQNILIVVPDTTMYAVVWDDMAALMKAQLSEVSYESKSLVCYPEEEVLPFDEREISANLLALRQECIERLLSSQPAVVITTIRSLLKKIPLPDSIRSYEVTLSSGGSFKFDYLSKLLPDMGFDREDVVAQVGSYAIRGGIVDIYPFSAENPVRIEFDGDVVASLRSFDVVSQRSIASVEKLTLYPRTEKPHGEVAQSGGCILDYMGAKDVIAEYEPALLESSLDTYRELILERHAERAAHPGTQVKSPDEAFLTKQEVVLRISRFQRIQFTRLAKPEFEALDLGTGGIPSFNGHLNLLREMLSKKDKTKSTLILCSNAGQVERLDELLDSDEVHSGMDYGIGVGDLHEGFEWPDPWMQVLTDHQIFGRPKRPRVHKKFKSAQALRHIHSFKAGDYVVHVDHGIAQYVGLEKVRSGDHTEECLKLLYQNGDKLFVPLEHFARVQKFSAEEGVSPRLNRLGSAEWAKVKSRTKKSIKDIAQDLIRLYAVRKSKQGFKFSEDTHFQYQMEASFEFEDTPDQTTVTAEIKTDMESDMPMDRLVCGDVGFGKTEVAIRAAFKCVLDNKQVAVLVPTTILADQHFETFSERLKEFAVRVDVISRFRTVKEQKTVLEKSKRGEIDVLIGTHRLLSKDVEFKDLGLLVIDEEQRFGVTHKEKLRQMKTTVDTLTLTATPIPRTLNFSLMGGRDLSVINTPPQNRLPIKTEITQFDEALIRHSITQELDRGGQVYFVHNRVQTIERVAETVRQIVPKARYAIVHGQMPPSKLENVLHDFMKKKYDVLVATAIIENGIDIANVNTILVDNAHHFGMAQLYQLRGRVGRSNKQAYCYLLTPPFNILPTEALRKLQAIEEFTELGSGFLIAMRDLEIRGAGNILGAEQSGYINSIGFELYVQILEEAVAEVREEQEVVLPQKAHPVKKKPQREVHVEVFCDTYIPEDYVNVQSERIRIYKEFADAATLYHLHDIERELLDRFGPLPDEVRHLLLTMEIKLRALYFGFERVVVEETKFRLRFDKELVKSKMSTSAMKEKLDSILRQTPNLRLMPGKDTVDIVVGYPWCDVGKSQVATPEHHTDADILAAVNDFLGKIETNHDMEQEETKHASTETTERP